MIREALKRWLEKPSASWAKAMKHHPQMQGPLMANLENTPVVTVWAISNGYLLMSGMGNGAMVSTITYVKDLSEIGDQIATMKARVAIGVPSDVRMPLYHANPIGSGNR